MYCVNCGSLLQSDNRAGLVCQPCRQVREKKRRNDERPLVIRYCFRCGKPYHPRDTSIQHPFCGAEQAAQHIASELRQHVPEKREG